MAYYDSTFYLASQREIKLFNLIDDYEEGSENRLTVNVEEEVATISPEDMKIHQVMIYTNDNEETMVMVALETLDNQIDFNVLTLLNKAVGEDFEYEFTQYREVVPRNDRFDPVSKFLYSVNKWGYMTAITLRESGKADIYYNGSKISSINEASDTIHNIELTFDELYFQVGKSELRSIKTELETRMCMDESEQKKGIIFPNIFYQKIKNHCMLYNSFVFIKTFMLVAHGHIVSFFSVLKQKWIRHFEFDCQVEGIFRLLDENEEFEVLVLLNDGRIKFINRRGNDDPESEEYSLDTELELQCKGKLVTYDSDRDENQWAFVLSSEPNEEKESGYDYILNILHKRALYTFTD